MAVSASVSKLFNVPPGGQQFFQSVFARWRDDEDYAEFFSDDHVFRHCRGMPQGTSQIFVRRQRRSLRALRAAETIAAVPADISTNQTTLHHAIQAAYAIQVATFMRGASFAAMDGDKLKEVEQTMALVEKQNEVLLAGNYKQLKHLGLV